MSEETETTEVDTPVLAATSTPKPQSIADLKPKMQLSGIVTRIELYGAFIDLGIGVNALIHISQLGQEHVNRVADVLSVGQEVSVWVDKVDVARNQIMVTMIKPMAVDWNDLEIGQVYTGTITRLENFGAFVNIGAEREGLVHISELNHNYVKHPNEAVSVGEEVRVQVLGFSKRKRRIDLSIKALLERPEAAAPSYVEVDEVEYDEPEEEEALSAMEFALRQALGDDYDSGKGGRNRNKKASKNRRRNERDRIRAQQDDILSRTLHVHQN
ncbi:MAG TPA: S1 RNA-binding domain-containing protein [Chloroflexota bacterium]|nr:S1 RNA-binding domain-containing protein [Chloroflexota bacterium]HUM68407.1 S1 RNA-binding domain-containing protein [Chloroflexota bacterium]